MAVYVDSAFIRYPRRGAGYMLMCHMLADSLEELHAMADRIGVARHWYQPGSTPHYDICKAKRNLAIQNGAYIIDNMRLANLCKEWRERQRA